MSFQQWNRLSLCGRKNSRTPFCSWGFAPASRAPPGIELQDCELPLFTVLMEFKPSPFSIFSLVPMAVSNFLLSVQLLLGRCAFPVFFPWSPSSLHPQKWLAAHCSFSLLKFTSPCHIPAEFCGSGCADCCVNPQISSLGVLDGLVLVWLYFMDTKHKKLLCCSAILAPPSNSSIS